jgi:hypothetical protein
MFKNMAEVIKANKRTGQHWFDAETLEYWNTKIIDNQLNTLPNGRQFFVSSDNQNGECPGLTIREALSNGKISTVGEGREYTTYAEAFTAAGRLLTRAGYISHMEPAK